MNGRKLPGPHWARWWVWLGLLLLTVPAGGQSPCTGPVLYTVTEQDDLLRVVSLEDFSVISTHRIQLPGSGTTVIGGTGIAIHPRTGELFLLVTTDVSPTNPSLVIYDVGLGRIVNPIGPTTLNFGDLAFDRSGNLFAVTSDLAVPPSVLFELNLQTGSPTRICALGAGDEGEALASNPIDGLLYHASGAQQVIFESIDDPGTDPCGTTSIPLSPFLAGEIVTAMTWNPSTSSFLWKQELDGGRIFSVTTTGQAIVLGSIGHAVSDGAVGEGFVPCPDFRRGDADGNSSVQGIVDAVFLLSYQFLLGSPAPPCLDAADADDSGSVTGLVDALMILNFAHVGGSPPPPDPGPFVCGSDPTPDPIGCETAPDCP